jgi:hypothetical protein
MVSSKCDGFVTLSRVGCRFDRGDFLILMGAVKSCILQVHKYPVTDERQNMSYYTILEATNLLIAQYDWELRRCRRHYDDGPLRYVLIDRKGAVVTEMKLRRQRRHGLSLQEVLVSLTHQDNAELATAAAKLLMEFGELTEFPPQQE